MLAAISTVVWRVIAIFLIAVPAYAGEAAPNPMKPIAPAGLADGSVWQFGVRERLCVEWTDGCRGCRRVGSTEFSCSNVGIACQQKDIRCTVRMSAPPSE